MSDTEMRTRLVLHHDGCQYLLPDYVELNQGKIPAMTKALIRAFCEGTLELLNAQSTEETKP